MKFNFLRKKKEEKEVVNNANEIVERMVFEKAIEENQKKEKQIKKLKEKNKNLEKNLEVLQVTIEEIKKICNDTNAKVVSKSKILKELGE